MVVVSVILALTLGWALYKLFTLLDHASHTILLEDDDEEDEDEDQWNEDQL